MTMHRLRIAGDTTFLEATDQKQATAYVRVVEGRYGWQADGSFADSEPVWYDATFKGKWAEAVQRDYVKGDNLVVEGDVVKHSKETADGRTFHNNRLYVKAFGPDAILSRVSLDRTPHPDRSHPWSAVNQIRNDLRESSPRVAPSM